jgi:hypothetical protein
MRTIFAVVGLVICLGGCSSSSKSGGYMLPDPYDNASTAAPEAFDSGFTFRKEMPDRRDAKPWQFYYKNCENDGHGSYYSRTSYTCNGPYY